MTPSTTEPTTVLPPVRPLPPTGTDRLFLAGSYPGHAQHLAAFGPLDTGSVGPDFTAVLEASGLTGRGGAAFASVAETGRDGRIRERGPAGAAAGGHCQRGRGGTAEP